MGDDLRQDLVCQHIFRFMNRLWAREGVLHRGLPAQCRLFGVQPVDALMGCLEFIPDCIPINKIKSLPLSACLDKMVASAAGSKNHLHHPSRTQ